MQTVSQVGCGLAWQVGNGEDIRIGIDPIIGTENLVVLPQDLREYLEDYGIVTLAQARNFSLGAKSYWFTAEDLDLGGDQGLCGTNLSQVLNTVEPDCIFRETHLFGDI